MSLSTLPLSYCTNVHPAQTIEQVIHGLRTYTQPAQGALGQRIAAGLWLPASAIQQIEEDPTQLTALRKTLDDSQLVCYTLNTFPYGNFHSRRVKENVYLPDWSTSERLDYTRSCAEALVKLMPDGVEGSLSTVPLGFKEFEQGEDFLPDCVDNLLQLAMSLDELHDETGRVVRLAIEPEPLCVLETTPETVKFFRKLYDAAESRRCLDIALRHLGVCYDVCHQAVEFEDVQQSIEELAANEIRMNKVHITCAVRIEDPSRNIDGRTQLAEFVEPRYLHQSFARRGDRIVSVTDLTRELCLNPSTDFGLADEWRIHFHVPVNREQMGALQSTRDDLKRALIAVSNLDYAPHLEVETYTWTVLPGEEQPELVDGLVAELRATEQLLQSIR